MLGHESPTHTGIFGAVSHRPPFKYLYPSLKVREKGRKQTLA